MASVVIAVLSVACGDAKNASTSADADAEDRSSVSPPETLSENDGPFGIEVGSPATDFKECQRQGDVLRCRTVPKVHPAFERYDLRFSDETGVCQVGGIGKTIKNDAYGTALRQAADELARQIESKYGAGFKKYDFLASGSIWDDPDDWTMGLTQNERVYAYFWSAEDGYEPRDHVQQLAVTVNGLDRSDGWVQVVFEFDNFEACKAEEDAKQADAF